MAGRNDEHITAAAIIGFDKRIGKSGLGYPFEQRTRKVVRSDLWN